MRWGQVVFNVAMAYFTDEALNAQGTDIDPFYDNSKVVEFLDYLFGPEQS
jgi:hypothetical protein